MAAKLDVPAPLSISADSLATAERNIAAIGPNGECICTYCPVNRCGGIFWRKDNLWSLWTPIDPIQFIALIEANGVTAPKHAAFERWRETILLFATEEELGRHGMKN